MIATVQPILIAVACGLSGRSSFRSVAANKGTVLVNAELLDDPDAKIHREAKALLRALRDADAFQGIPLRPGISEQLFGKVIVRCLLRYKDVVEELRRNREEFRGPAYLQTKRIRTTLKRAASVEWPPLAQEAKRLHEIDGRLRVIGEPRIRNLENRLKYLDPVVCLYVLFKSLVRLDRKQSVEYYEKLYFPRILTAAEIWSSRGKPWTFVNIQRHLRRTGGEPHARRVAGLLLSTHPALHRYRPEPTFRDGVTPALGEHLLRFQARGLYCPW